MVARAEPAPTGRVAVIAGSGRLPADVLRALCDQEMRPLAVLIEGEADEAASVGDTEQVSVRLEDAGHLVSLLQRHHIRTVVMAGGIGRRPRLRDFRIGLGLVRMLPATIRALRSGDDALLKAVIAHLGAHGIGVVGAHQVAPALLAGQGAMTIRVPDASDRRDMIAAIAAARSIGDLDIGQGAVAIGGRVVALEGIEGTDGLLARVVTLRDHPRLAGREGGVLAKCAKPGQDLRADLPAIGPGTISAAHEAGLSGVAVEADRAFLLARPETIALADRLGLFVFGFSEAAR